MRWPLIADFSSPSASNTATCTFENNLGWRCAYWTVSGLTLVLFLLRFFSSVYEIPKYLLGCKRDAEVVAVAQNIAVRNKTTTWLTVSHLKAVDTRPTDGRTNETSNTEPKRVVQVSVCPKIEPGIARLVMGVGPTLHCPELSTYGEVVADCNSMTCCERVFFHNAFSASYGIGLGCI